MQHVLITVINYYFKLFFYSGNITHMNYIINNDKIIFCVCCEFIYCKMYNLIYLKTFAIHLKYLYAKY